jgi:hypothetical protein
MIGNAQMVRSAERRTWERQQCSLPITVKTLELGGVHRWPAQSCDLSAGGLSLMLERRFEPATLVAATLEQPQAHLTVLARVVRVAPMKEGGWLLGCQMPFPIDAEELSELLASQPAPAPVAPETAASLRERLLNRLRKQPR